MRRWLPWAFGIYAALSLVSMATMSIGAALLILALVVASGPAEFLARVRSELKRPYSRGFLRLSAALSIACVITLVAAKFFPLTYGGQGPELRFFGVLGKLWYLFWPLLLVVGLRVLTEDERRRVLQGWLVAFAVLSVVGIVQYYVGWPRPQMIPGNEPRYHATIFLGHHLSVASIWIFPFFAALDFLIGGARNRKALGLSPKVLFAGVSLGAVALFFTYSRMLWIGLPAGVLLLALWALPRRWAIAAAIGFALALAGLVQVPQISKRIHAGMGVNDRYELWRANYQFFKDRPLTGTGWHHNEQMSGVYLPWKHPGEYVFIGHGHNNLIDMLGGTGLLGTLAWLAWCAGVLWITWKASRNEEVPNFARGLLCAWVVFHINGLTQVNFWEGKVMHQMSFVIAWALLWASARRTI